MVRDHRHPQWLSSMRASSAVRAVHYQRRYRPEMLVVVATEVGGLGSANCEEETAMTILHPDPNLDPARTWIRSDRWSRSS